MAAVAARVREAPVAVNESVARPTSGLVREVTVLGIRAEVRADPLLELRCVVAFVVKVKLDFTQTEARETSEGVEIRRRVLLTRKEKRVPRRQAVRVAELSGQRGIFTLPALDALPAVLGAGPAPEGFEMVAEREQDVAWAFRPRFREAFDDGSRISADPAMDVSRGKTEGEH
jgi:hypothetical protein